MDQHLPLIHPSDSHHFLHGTHNIPWSSDVSFFLLVSFPELVLICFDQGSTYIYHLHQTTEYRLPAVQYGYRFLPFVQISDVLFRAAPTTCDYLYQCAWLVGDACCGQGFVTFDELVVHLGHAHDAQGPSHRKLVCRWWVRGGPCDKECRRHGFRRHIRTHFKFSTCCRDCGKRFSRVDTLRVHIKKEHTGASLPAGL